MSLISATQGIRDEIASRLNEAEIDSTDQYTNWIHLGLNDIVNTDPLNAYWRTSADRTLSSGTRIYTNLPSDFAKMNTVVSPSSDVKLTWLEPEEFDILQPSATEGGNPNIFTIRGQGANGRIEFYPQPGSSLTVHYDYQRTPAVISSGSSIPDLPTKYLELLVLYGEYQGLKRKGLRTEAREVQQEYETLKQRMLTDLRKQSTEGRWIRNPREFTTSRQDFGNPISNIFNSP